MRIPLLAILAPILSISILSLGNGFYTTLTTVQLEHIDGSVAALGIISSCYFIGLLVGSYYTQHVIIRVGHVRSFAAFASVMAVGVLWQAAVHNLVIWGLIRAVSGFSLAGLFIVVESWMLSYGTADSKGRILAIYLFVYYIVQTVSQLLVGVPYSNMLFAFMLIAGLCSFSILPAVLWPSEAPQPESPQLVSPWFLFKQAPLGLIGALASGLVLGVIYSIQPFYLSSSGSTLQQVAYVMAATVLGGALLQIPVGKFSDRLDRRYVLFAVSFLTAALMIAALIVKPIFAIHLVVCCLLGGLTFTLYPISMNLATDCVAKTQTTSVIAIVTLAYGVGSALGPVTVSVLLHGLGNKGYFAYMLLVMGLLAVYSFYHLLQPAPKQKQFMASIPESAIITEQMIEEQQHASHSVSKSGV